MKAVKRDFARNLVVGNIIHRNVAHVSEAKKENLFEVLSTKRVGRDIEVDLKHVDSGTISRESFLDRMTFIVFNK